MPLTGLSDFLYIRATIKYANNPVKNMKNKNKNKERLEPVIDVSSVPVTGMPETAFDMVNRYGTYNIQSTAETENMYPTVAQGFNKDIIKTDCDENTDDDEKKK